MPAFVARRLPSSPFAIALVACLLFRFVAIAIVPLIPEEAYYWMYAQHPAMGYFDHPPMVAWVIGAGTFLFGDTELGVRFTNTLLMVGASVALFVFGRQWFDRRAAWTGAVALHVLPMYFGAGFVTTMDAALVAFWATCLAGVGHALRTGRPGGWYVAGVAVGGAMLSKYTGVFLAAGAFACIVVRPQWRARWLSSPHPWLALLIAAVAFAPCVVWNWRHDWASFRFQFVDRYADAAFDVRHVLSFLGFQLIALTPVGACGVALFLWRFVARPRRALSPRQLIVLAFSVPLLAVTAYKSLRYDVHMNWTLPAYLALMPAVAHWTFASARLARWGNPLRPWRWSAGVCVGVNVGLLVYLVALQPRLQLFAPFGPWRELAGIVEHHEDELERATGREPLVVCDGKYRLASVMAFYRAPVEDGPRAADYTTSRWILGGEGLAYEYWTDRADWVGRDCVYVADGAKDDLLTELRPWFDSVEVVDDPRLRTMTKKGFGIAICRGLRARPVTAGETAIKMAPPVAMEPPGKR